MSTGAMSILMSMLALGFVLVAVLVGIVLIFKSRRVGFSYPACGKCHYDLSATVGTATRCPECGVEFLTSGIIAPGARPRSRLMLVMGILLIVGGLLPLCCFGVILPTAGSARRATATIRAPQPIAPPDVAPDGGTETTGDSAAPIGSPAVPASNPP